jgi:hypothetical protein
MNRRPKLTLRGSSASPEEAAAVIAAIEPEGPSPWVRTALREGVDREPVRTSPGW